MYGRWQDRWGHKAQARLHETNLMLCRHFGLNDSRYWRMSFAIISVNAARTDKMGDMRRDRQQDCYINYQRRDTTDFSMRDGRTPTYFSLSYAVKAGPPTIAHQSKGFRLSTHVPTPIFSLVYEFVGASQRRFLPLFSNPTLCVMDPKRHFKRYCCTGEASAYLDDRGKAILQRTRQTTRAHL